MDAGLDECFDLKHCADLGADLRVGMVAALDVDVDRASTLLQIPCLGCDEAGFLAWEAERGSCPGQPGIMDPRALPLPRHVAARRIRQLAPRPRFSIQFPIGPCQLAGNPGIRNREPCTPAPPPSEPVVSYWSACSHNPYAASVNDCAMPGCLAPLPVDPPRGRRAAPGKSLSLLARFRRRVSFRLSHVRVPGTAALPTPRGRGAALGTFLSLLARSRRLPAACPVLHGGLPAPGPKLLAPGPAPGSDRRYCCIRQLSLCV
jgi:hypothetical protein